MLFGSTIWALRALNVLGKALLVVQLDLGKLLLHGGIVLILHQLLKLSSIVDEAVARQLGDKGSKLGFDWFSQRRCAMPFVTFLNLFGHSV